MRKEIKMLKDHPDFFPDLVDIDLWTRDVEIIDDDRTTRDLFQSIQTA